MGNQQDITDNAVLGILLAFVYMIAATVATALVGWLLAWQPVYWIGGGIIGGAISFGYRQGKGKQGVLRYGILILLSIVGAYAAVLIGYALFFYNQNQFWSLGFTFEFTFNFMSYGFSNLFNDHGDLARNFLGAALTGIVTGWSDAPFNKKEDLEELE